MLNGLALYIVGFFLAKSPNRICCKIITNLSLWVDWGVYICLPACMPGASPVCLSVSLPVCLSFEWVADWVTSVLQGLQNQYCVLGGCKSILMAFESLLSWRFWGGFWPALLLLLSLLLLLLFFIIVTTIIFIIIITIIIFIIFLLLLLLSSLLLLLLLSLLLLLLLSSSLLLLLLLLLLYTYMSACWYIYIY